MKIAVHTSHYPYSTPKQGYVCGGGERVAEEVAERLAKRNHDLTVYTASNGKAKRDHRNGVNIVRHRSWIQIGNSKIAPRQLLTSSQVPDVIHIHNTTPPGVISGTLHSLFTGAPIVLTHHGHDRYTPVGSFPRRLADFAYTGLLLDLLLEQADVITIPSEAYLSESPRLTSHRAKIAEIPNGIDTTKYSKPGLAGRANEWFDLDPDTFTTVFLGNLIPKKGPMMLVKALKKLGSDVQAIIAGDGPLLADIRRLAPPYLRVPGYVSEAQKVALLNRADVVCLPSQHRTEVFPMVILESFAAGTPVVVSDLATFERFVKHEETGLRFNQTSLIALVESISRLMEDPDFCNQLGREATKQARKFAWENIIDQYESTLQRTTEPGRGSP